jgi:hypothetical protein
MTNYPKAWELVAGDRSAYEIPYIVFFAPSQEVADDIYDDLFDVVEKHGGQMALAYRPRLWEKVRNVNSD